MINAYKIGVELALTGNVARVIADLTRQFDTLNVAVKSVQSSLAGMTQGMRGVADLGKQAAQAWTEAANAMHRASGGGGGGRGPGGFGGFLPGFAGGAAGGFLAGGGGGGYGGGGNLRLGGPGGGGMPPLTPGGGGGAGGGPGGGMSSHGYALAAAGYGMVAGGISAAGRATLGAAGDVSHLRAMLLAQGVSPAEADATVAQARGIARATPGITIGHALGAAVDLKSILGGTDSDPTSMGPALTALPAFTQMMAVLNIAGRQRGDPTYAAARAQELLGHLVDERTHGVSSEALQRQLDMALRVSVATNNRVNPTDYMMFARRARAAGMSLNEDALYGTVPSLIQQLGGSQAGTGAMAMFRQFSTGTMTQNRVAELQRLGILNRRAHWDHGRVTTMQRDLVGYDQIVSDPVQWIASVLKPALERAGITDRLAQARAAQSLGSTATAGGFMSDVLAGLAAIMKEAANIRASQTGGQALNTLMKSDYTANTAAFSAAFHNMLTDIGGPLMQPAIDQMKSLGGAMRGIGEFADKHPDMTRRIAYIGEALLAVAGVGAAVAGGRLLFGPMLALLAPVEAFFARLVTMDAAFAGATVGGGMAAVLGFLGRLIGPLGAIGLVFEPSATNGGRDTGARDSNETRELERRRTALGQPSLFSSAPAAGAPPEGMTFREWAGAGFPVTVTNGRDLAAGVSREQGEQMSRPASLSGPRRTGRLLPAVTPGVY
jgi:hypothetical protein